jgi:catechol 2,3-dioxygenase-like lactoylglutathione lyase family enzyme
MTVHETPVRGIHHIAFAVHDAEQTLKDWESALGLKGRMYEFPDHKKGTLYIGGSMFAFIEYTVENERFSEFLRKHGEGLHHIALEVEDLDSASQRVVKSGFHMQFGSPQDAGIGTCDFVVDRELHAAVELVQPDDRSDAMRAEVTGKTC